jgi:3-deoxy-manno-octulosonate cytidylyltransferase (CMP-KDO synthetase)
VNDQDQHRAVDGNPIVIIPARMASTRLPGKPLADILGEPMIVHVWRRGVEASVGRVVVAAAEKEIVHAVELAGGEAVLTKRDHPSGSDRIKEAVDLIDPNKSHDVVINLQGDLPNLDSSVIRSVLDPLGRPSVDISTLISEITDDAERTDPNVVKAVMAINDANSQSASGGRALYFTRAQAPFGDGPLYHHIGIYAYRREALNQFVALPPSPLELREKLEQLRALEAYMRIDAALVDTIPFGVDTPADLDRVRCLMAPK